MTGTGFYPDFDGIPRSISPFSIEHPVPRSILWK